jgi:DtxR family transcriptional regulator, Mn-dependent transcriptional regulator
MESRGRRLGEAGRPVHVTDRRRAVTTRTQNAEEYLEAIFKLQRGREPVTVKRLAVELSVSPPSVSEMIARLRSAGLVEEPAEGRGITLTDVGAAEGATLVRRHRLSERFLVDYLDMPWDAVHEEACKLEHVLSPEVEARLAEQLGNPLTCPHGHVIPDEDGSLAEPELRPLSGLDPGDEAVISCIAEEKSDLLRYLASLGLLPDTPITVESVAPFNGPLLVRVGGSQYALGREVTDKIMVRG